jgi:putative nucleotidyltransferase with HDIG domain
VPIRAGDDVIGALLINRQSPQSFSAEDTRLLTTLAEIAGNAIHRMLSYEEVQRRADEFRVLYDTANELAGQTGLPAVLETILRQAVSLLRTSHATISLYDPARQELEVVAEKNLPALAGARIKLGEGIAGYVASTRQVLVLEDYRSWEGRLPGLDQDPIKAAIGAPMIYHGELIGSIGVADTEAVRKFNEADGKTLSLFAAQAASAIQNAQLFAQTDQRLQHISALHDVDMAISNSFDLRFILDVLLGEVTHHLHIDAADILLFNPHTQMLETSASRGFRTGAIAKARLRLGQGLAGRAALEQRMVRVPDLSETEGGFMQAEMSRREGFVAFLAVPLIIKGQTKGVLEVFHRAALAVDDEWLKFLETMAGQAAIAIDNASLFSGLQQANTELALAYEATIEGWSHALDLRDRETEGHTRRVTEISLQLADEVALSPEALRYMRWGALLHDIGKMGIPDQILLKPGPLTEEEWVIMRRHPTFAYEMLSPIRYLQPALDIPYCHHEKWDGTGYPRGLRGEQIPLPARIFAVVDVWDALTSDRPYRKAWSHEQALEYIARESGKHFDPNTVDIFLRIMRRMGSWGKGDD